MVIFTICSINTRFFTCLDYVYKDSWKIYVQHIQQWYLSWPGTYEIKGVFQHPPLAGLTKFIVYLQVCHWLSKQVFYSTEILFFVLIPRYDCFELRMCQGVIFVYAITKTMCPPGCHHSHFVQLKATHALGSMMYGLCIMYIMCPSAWVATTRLW